jgi:hypothetical protein
MARQSKSSGRSLPGEIGWVCPFCQQSVAVQEGGLRPASAMYFAICLLREYMVGKECIAYRDARKARELLMDRD